MAQLIQNSTYEIIREIGKGGAGTVLLAYHKGLQTYVVLKKMHSFVPINTLRNEVDTLKQLRHANLPTVHDFFVDGDSAYTVMDYVEGQPLSTYIEQGVSFPEQTVRHWLEQLSDVLRTLHEKQILHCDIKPQNIMITPAMDAVLIDFNIALVVGQGDLTGISMAYASPEQVELARQISCHLPQTAQIDARSDVYSLAATFYHLLSGRMPYALTQMPPLTDQVLGYSEALTRLLDRAMSRDPAERPADGLALHQEVIKLNRQNTRYRMLFLSRIASILISGALIAGGIYCLIAADKAKISEAYSADLQSLYYAAELGDTARLESECLNIIQNPDYSGILEENPDDKAKIYAQLGDVDYQNERYLSAAHYYSRAAELSTSYERGTFWKNAIVATAEGGNLQEALSMCEDARALSMLETERLLVETVLASKQNDQQKCLASAQALIRSGADANSCAEGAIAAAKVCTDVSQKIQWLELAASYQNTKTTKRTLAQAYVALANQSSSGKEGLLQKALTLYRDLAANAYASKADRLNYSVVLRMVGQPGQAQRQLEELCRDYPEDYRVWMQLAFASHEAGDDTVSRQSCEKALQYWRADTGADRESEQSENIQNLMELSRWFFGRGG